MTSSWIQYLRHAFIVKKYIRGEIDIGNIDVLTVNDEFQTNWNELWQEYKRQEVYRTTKKYGDNTNERIKKRKQISRARQAV